MKDETDDRDIQSNLAVQKAAVASHYISSVDFLFG